MGNPFTVLLSVHEESVRRRARTLVSGYDSVDLVAECTTAAHTLLAMREHEPSVVLLDAQMPDLDGFGIVGEIGPEAMPSVVFLSVFDSTILRVLEIHAINYLLLPLDEDRFHATFARALRQAEGRALAGVRRRLVRLLAADEEGSKERRIPVRNAGEAHYVDLDDIRWVESTGTFVRLHLDDRTHIIKVSLDHLAERFADDFVRIQSILVRTSEIAEIQLTNEGDSMVKLRGGNNIRLSRIQPPQVSADQPPQVSAE